MVLSRRQARIKAVKEAEQNPERASQADALVQQVRETVAQSLEASKTIRAAARARAEKLAEARLKLRSSES